MLSWSNKKLIFKNFVSITIFVPLCLLWNLLVSFTLWLLLPTSHHFIYDYHDVFKGFFFAKDDGYHVVVMDRSFASLLS
jgi:hypothetical protein